MKELGKRAAGAVIAGLMAVSAIAPAGVALADNNPSVGAQTGTGKTDLTMILEHTGEFGGTEINDPSSPYYNPDANNDGVGDNLAFKVPSAINYVVKADGSLVGPSGVYIENLSNFKTRVSALDVDAVSPFAIVADVSAAANASTNNVVDLTVGPTGDPLNAASYLSKTAVGDPNDWEMDATNSGATDQVALTSSGHVRNVTADITAQTKFGELHWYVSAGPVPSD